MGRNGILLLGVCLAALTAIIAGCAKAGQYTLQVAVEPPNAGHVLVEPLKPFYGHGELVWLTAEPSTDFVFSHWREEEILLDFDNPTDYKVTASHRITAYFVRQGQPLPPRPPPPPPTSAAYKYLIIFFAIILYEAIITLRESKSATRQHRLVKPMRWAARVIGLSGTVLLLFHTFAAWTSGDRLLSSGAVVTFTGVTIAIALAGCIISWWQERFAGRLLIVTSLAVLINPIFNRHDYYSGFLVVTRPYHISDYLEFGSPLLVAGVLFLLSWWLSRETASRISALSRLAREMRWTARVIGLGGILLLLFGVFAASMFGGHLLSSSTIVILTAATIAMALASCIISWWREWLAGILLIVTSFGLVINPIFVRLSWTGLYYIGDYLIFGSPLLVAGLLFLLSWWLSRKTSSSVAPSTLKL